MDPTNTAAPALPSPSLVVALLAFAIALSMQAQTTPPPKPAPAPEKPDEPITLSPFEVTASDDQGYYGANTMSGTRLNAKLEDLAASITVVTKEQMQDLAMLDINDIFNYEAGTEGTGNFTDVSFNSNGEPTDNTQINPQDANRIRGVGSANTSFGNFQTSGRVPIDPIDVDAVEINRGPNSSIFGVGNPAGTVNSVPATANLSQDRSQVAVRADSRGGYRSTVDLNRVLKQGVLAVRGSAVIQHDGFNLKPSGTDSTKLKGMVKYRPFKNTTLSASYSDFRSHGNRPNAGMPRDSITGWRNAGQPTWDPVTRRGHLDGVEFTNPAPYFGTVGATHSQVYIDRTGIVYWGLARGTSTTPASISASFGEMRGALSDPTGFLASQPLFQDFPVVTDKSIYDWSEINLAAANRFNENAQIATATLDQWVFDTERQSLAVQLGWFRESAERFTRNTVGQSAGSANSTATLQVDVNERLLDGSPNPFFMRPFIGITSNSFHNRPLDRDTYRAQLAYTLDLRREKGLLRWLGKHQVSAYGEYKDFRDRSEELKDAIVDFHSWIPANRSRGRQGTGVVGWSPALQSGLVYYRQYLGDNNGFNVDYPSTALDYGTYTMTWGNATTNPTPFTREPVEIGAAGTGVTKSQNVLRSRGAILHSSFLDDRIVTTFGWRHDKRSSRSRSRFVFQPDGIHFDYFDFEPWTSDWDVGEGPTKTAGVVVKPLPWLRLFANKSDSFQPQSLRYSLRLQPLPDVVGEGEDFGIGLNLFGGKLNVRANYYTTTQLNNRNGSSGNISSRIVRIDFNESPQNFPFRLEQKATEWAEAAAAASGVTLTSDQLNQQVADIMKVPVEALRYSNAGFPVSATQDVTAKGVEIEVNYNPTSFWTAKLNVTKQESINANMSPDITTWIAERLPVWQSIIDPLLGRPWFTEPYEGKQSASAYFQGSVAAPLQLETFLDGKSRPQIRKYRANASTNFQLAGITGHRILKRFNIGGALRWEDKGAIGYHGLQPLPAIVTALDVNRPIYDKTHLYVDLLVGYRTSLFADKVRARFQLNVRNLTEGGRLQPVAADPDGRPIALRIVDPRLFIFSVTFDL